MQPSANRNKQTDTPNPEWKRNTGSYARCCRAPQGFHDRDCRYDDYTEKDIAYIIWVRLWGRNKVLTTEKKGSTYITGPESELRAMEKNASERAAKAAPRLKKRREWMRKEHQARFKQMTYEQALKCLITNRPYHGCLYWYETLPYGITIQQAVKLTNVPVFI
jgi:hypothetical protein